MNHAQIATKQGLRNSEGWIDMPPGSRSQRTAPLPKSVPTKGRSTMAVIAMAKPSTPMRRTWRGEKVETTTINAIAAPPNTAWRMT